MGREPNCPLCGGPWSSCACNFSQSAEQASSQEQENRDEEQIQEKPAEGVECPVRQPEDDEGTGGTNRFIKIATIIFLVAVIIMFCIDYFRRGQQ